MCGLWALFRNPSSITKTDNIYSDIEKYKELYDSLLVRGPDVTKTYTDYICHMVFHRLIINDACPLANQPLIHKHNKNLVLMCNGEIYNHKEIETRFELTDKLNSRSDCEIILALYHYMMYTSNVNMDSIEDVVYRLCRIIEGEFAFIMYDKIQNKVIIARDDFGVRPLFIGLTEKSIMLASELKGMDEENYNPRQFNPGHFMIMNMKDDYKKMDIEIYDAFTDDIRLVRYSRGDNNLKMEGILGNIKKLLIQAVKTRIENADFPVCSLLSGGLDSSLVAAIASKYLKAKGKVLETFAIGLEGAPDLKNAAIVAKHIGSKHTNVVMTQKEFLNGIDETIRVIESYDVTTVRASTGNRLVTKYIKDNTDNKCVLSGEMADEVAGGYQYKKYYRNEKKFHDESCRLVNEIHFFDNLRSDRSISCNGLEGRVPFSDREFVNYYMSIPADMRMPSNNNNIEKYLLRKAFEVGLLDEPLLPDEILWRPKVAFSDGVSTIKRKKISFSDDEKSFELESAGNDTSWHMIIKRWIDNKVSDSEFNKKKDMYKHIKPYSKEAYYYRKIWSRYYRTENVIPHYWQPRNEDGTVISNDPSARELKDIYKE